MNIAFTGCWHSTKLAAKRAIDYCHDNNIHTLIQTGDFLYKKSPGMMLSRWIEAYLEQNNINLTIIGIRGNHDDPSFYRNLPDVTGGDWAGQGFREITPHVLYAPDGLIATIGGLRVAFCGGAYSVDRPARVLNIDYWADETCDPDALIALTEGDGFDILVTHDVPAGIPLTLPPPPRWWEITEANAHRIPLGDLTEAQKPPLVVSGHMHAFHDQNLTYSDGTPYRSIVLDRGDYSHSKPLAAIMHDFIHTIDTGKIVNK